jgi:hypothetical protein
MADKTYIVHFKRPETMVQPVQAITAEVVDDYLVFYNEAGELAAFFLLEIVESWAVKAIN